MKFNFILAIFVLNLGFTSLFATMPEAKPPRITTESQEGQHEVQLERIRENVLLARQTRRQILIMDRIRLGVLGVASLITVGAVINARPSLFDITSAANASVSTVFNSIGNILESFFRRSN